MNLESINKWLDEEYGCSYTRLEELHDFYFEKYTDQKEEINRLNNIINETRRILGEYAHYSTPTEEQNAKNEAIVDEAYMQLHNNLKELKGDNK
jgi:hypothetical protein